ncbi:protein FAM185A-like [Acropora muricata]|uniref:protein FAM185A-like n=1 Tax=Acropora muricata TaxID=159855 RepID=UPI0034E38ACC
MLKYQRSFLNLKRATVVLNRLHVRRKSHCISTTVIPAPFCGSPTIVIRSPYSVKVKPIDPVEYGDMKAVIGFLYLQTETDEEISERDKATLNEHIKYDMKSIWSHNREFVEVSCSRSQKLPFPLKDISLHFHIPVYYGAEIEVEGEASVNVSGLEGQLFEVMAEKGFCELKNLKGSRLSVETEGGDITCDSQLLFEFGTLTTKDKGRISVKKLQGKKFCLQSENGDIDVGATYLIRAEVASKQGQVRLGDIHGLTEVNVDSGDIAVGSTCGTLKAVTRSGNINASLLHHDDVVLKSREGNISVKILEESVSSELKVKSESVNIDSKLNFVKTEEDVGQNFIVMTAELNPKKDMDGQLRTITAEAKLGSVKFQKIDWLSSLKLNQREK